MANPANFLRSGSVPVTHLPPSILASMRRRNGPDWTPPTPSPAPDHPAIPGGAVVLRVHGNETGYGRMGRNLGMALESVGQPVRFVSLDAVGDGLHPFIRERLAPRGYVGPAIQMTSPWTSEQAGVGLFSCWETDRLPGDSVRVFGLAPFVVVPCEWNRKVFLDSGVTSPIRVVPLGIDPAIYRPDDDRGPSEAGRFVALSVNAVSGGGHRKGVPDLVAAFVEALGDRPDARLILKIDVDDVFEAPGHPRVIVDRGRYDDAGMAGLYRSADVYATMTRAEGVGLPIVEGMACGLPYVGPIHSGISDYVTEECAYPVDWDVEPSSGMYYEDCGDWFRPRHDSMVARLRAAYADRDGRRVKGAAAARRAAVFTWEASARKLLEVLREFGMVAHGPPDGKGETPRAPTPGLEREIRLTKLRRACPHGSKPPGCGCSGELECAKFGKRVLRAECFACLEGGTS